jgi:hypothetical protein
MSQENKADAAEARTQETRGFIQQVRVATRRKYTPEEKVRIVLGGVSPRSGSQRTLPSRRYQAGGLLCLDQRLYGGGQREASTGYHKGCHASGDRRTEA